MGALGRIEVEASCSAFRVVSGVLERAKKTKMRVNFYEILLHKVTSTKEFPFENLQWKVLRTWKPSKAFRISIFRLLAKQISSNFLNYLRKKFTNRINCCVMPPLVLLPLSPTATFSQSCATQAPQIRIFVETPATRHRIEVRRRWIDTTLFMRLHECAAFSNPLQRNKGHKIFKYEHSVSVHYPRCYLLIYIVARFYVHALTVLAVSLRQPPPLTALRLAFYEVALLKFQIACLFTWDM